MSRELKMRVDDIRSEMENIVVPFAEANGLTGMEAVGIAVRYGWERSKDYEWESNERAMSIIEGLVRKLNSPMNRFQRKYGRICLN